MTYPCLWFSLLTAGCFCKVTVETGRGSKDSSLSVACLCIRMSHLCGLEVLTCKNKHYKRKGLRVRRVQQSLFCRHQTRGLTVGRSLKCLQFSWRTLYDSLFWTRRWYSHLQNKGDFSQILFPCWRVTNLDSSLRVMSTICKSQTVCVTLFPP